MRVGFGYIFKEVNLVGDPNLAGVVGSVLSRLNKRVRKVRFQIVVAVAERPGDGKRVG